MSKVAQVIRKVKNTTCSVVVVAAGRSERMGQDKLFLPLEGMPVLARTLRAFDGCGFVDEIVVVAREDRLEQTAELCRSYGIGKVNKVVIGGDTRTKSVLAGVSSIRRDARIVLVHDGARPLVTEEIIRDAMHTAAMFRCAAPAIPVTDTVKEIRDNVVVSTPDRSSLVAVQTPQAFIPDLLKGALTAAVREGKEYTDDCAAVEAMGFTVRLSKGSPENIKITVPADLAAASAILRSRHE
ncbi:MAG: 2-C-methyl-D-erythritol 4-phosphate cytidylyltransferase [Oscillospiraceae bacterium]|nr:2-C-methyl-D-erythritol 4-phosphate cytidylyltransferase [Oscillospiraceae bacterium]